jgi:hypothetical protein
LKVVPLPKSCCGALFEDVSDSREAAARRLENEAQAEALLEKAVDRMMGDAGGSDNEWMSILQELCSMDNNCRCDT